MCIFEHYTIPVSPIKKGQESLIEWQLHKTSWPVPSSRKEPGTVALQLSIIYQPCPALGNVLVTME